MLDFQKAVDFYKGNFSARFFKMILLPISFLTFFGLLITSWLFFPGFYSIATNTISDLGNPILNPFPGWLFFSLAFWSLALFFPPNFMYLHNRLFQLHQIETIIGTFANYISSFGMILLGIFSNIPETLLMHQIAAILSFGGIGIAIFFYWLAVIHDSLQKALKYHRYGILMILIIISFLIIAIIFIEIVQITSDFPFSEFIWIFEFPFWEWSLLILLSLQLLFIGLIIPGQFSEKYQNINSS